MPNASKTTPDRWTIWRVLKQSFTEFSEDKCPRLGAAMAYYTIFSIAPLLVIAIGLLGWAGSVMGQKGHPPEQSPVMDQVAGLIGGGGGDALREMVKATSHNHKGGVIATVVGFVTLLFGATGVFGQLQDSLNTIWEVAPKPGRGIWGFIRDRFLSFAMVGGICFLLLVSLVVSTALSGFQHLVGGNGGVIHYLWAAVNAVVSLVVISGLFAMMFKVLPDVKMKWGDTLLGAVATATLFTLGKWGIGMYLGKAGVGSAYGAAGSAVVLLLWVYYSSQIFLMGAEFTHVYSCHLGSQYKPDDNAIELTEAQRIHEGIPHNKIIDPQSADPKSPQSPASPARKAPRRKIEPADAKSSSVLPVTVGFALGLAAMKLRRKPQAKKLVLRPGVRITTQPRPIPESVAASVWKRFRKGLERGVEEAK